MLPSQGHLPPRVPEPAPSVSHDPLAPVLLLLLAAIISFSGCGNRPPERGKGLRVTVSILPQAWFVQRIAGDLARVTVLVGPGQNPHSYEPTPQQMSDLSASRVWILSGTEFEKSLKPKISALYPSLLIVDGTAGVKFRSLEESLPEDGHDEASGRDPHTWLGREPVLILGRHIRDALTGIDPDHKTAYESNFLSMERQINDTFAGLRGKLRPLQGRSVLVFHPAFGYFLDEFGIRQSPVETGGKEPGPRALADLILQARREKVPVLFVQAQFSDRAARTVAGSVGAEVLPLDPLDPDWIGNIRRMGESLAKAVPVPP